ncbi:hypothetical protein GCM10009828_026980 [Actinoplanes couchii]|uniref:Uncharacterized protein n=1 Tax=Actinoplanes couchii TaxID=403638 RepID=A0ABQ3XA74_9ACTN|nr:hypothetical protein Aco03nite_037240 [Actinoplanes couchii]
MTPPSSEHCLAGTIRSADAKRSAGWQASNLPARQPIRPVCSPDRVALRYEPPHPPLKPAPPTQRVGERRHAPAHPSRNQALESVDQLARGSRAASDGWLGASEDQACGV